MAIKAGQILHAMNRTVVDRIQTAGAGNLNIPTEKIRELGNYQTVATVRDVPDLSFNLDCLDVDTEVEALLTGSDDPEDEVFGDGDSIAAAKFDILNTDPIDIVSPWKSRQGAFDIVRAVAIPHLTLEQCTYRYGLQENAGETFTLRGDSVFYVPGSAEQIMAEGDGSTTAFDFEVEREGATPFLEAVNALLYEEQGESIYALNVSVDGQRMFAGDDYTETATGIEFTTAPANGARIHIVFGFDPAQLPATNDYYPQSVHQGLSVKPAAIRGKDIDLYVAVVGPSTVPTNSDFVRWTDVQAFNVDWRATLEDDYEFGNPRAINRDYSDNPEVTGTVDVRHRDPGAMFAKLAEITGVPTSQIIGPQSSVTVHMMLKLKNPEGHGTTNPDVPDGPAGGGSKIGSVLKTLYIPDARFELPGYEGRVQQKLDQTMSFDSDGGVLHVFRGAPINGQFVAADSAQV